MPVKFIIAGTILIMLAIIDAVSLKIPNSLLVILLLSSIVYDLIFEHAKFASGCISFLVMFIIFGGIYYFYGGLGKVGSLYFLCCGIYEHYYYLFYRIFVWINIFCPSAKI